MVWIYVDDIRECPEANFVVRSYDEAIMTIDKLYESGESLLIDLDHDLGETKSGYDIAKYVVCKEYSTNRIKYRVHSMNPVGAFNIRQLMSHYGYKQV